MGLVNLQTNLKSLRFGNDRVNGGNSKQPYIQTPIPERTGEFGFLNQDFILRGGSKAVTDSVLDVERLGKYFTDLRNPSGLLFVAKQNLLSRTAARTQASGLLNEGIYTPLSTLAQASVSAFGGHLNKQGLNPFDGPGSIGKYSEVVTPNQSIYINRLVDFYSKIELKSSNDVNLYSYQGGPGAFLGIGETNIKLSDQRTGINNPQLRNIGFFDGFSSPLFYPTSFSEGSQTKDYDYSVFSIGNSDTNRAELESQISYQLGVSGKDIPEEYKDISNKNINYSIFKIGNSDTDRSDFISLNYNRGLGLSFLTTDKDSNKSLSDSEYTGFNQAGQLLSETEARDAKPSEPSKILISPPSSFKLINVNGLKLLGASNKFFTPLTPSDNGFTPEGKIDSNTRVVGSLDNPDETQSESPLNAGDDRTYTYSQADLVNIPRLSDGIDGISFYIGNNLTTTIVGDFRKKLRNNATSTQNTINSVVGNITNAPNYFTKNIEQRVNLGDPGDTNGKDLKSYTNGSNPGKIFGYSGGNTSPSSYDKINALPIYKSSEIAAPEYANDLVKFRIGIIDNNNPSLKTYIHFRAFLNQISDGYTADWSDSRYIGRGEKFYTYSGFDRKVSLSWTVAAQSKAELIPMYKKLNYLASVCAPDYSDFGYLRGNIVTLTIGGYFYEQPGIITGFNYEMNDDNATWEIGINDEGGFDSTVKELPHLIKVSGFNFIPIHTFVPRLQRNLYDPEGGVLTDSNQYGPERYISLENQGAFNGPASSTNNYGKRDPIPPPTPPAPTPPPTPTPTPTPQQQQALFGIQDVSGPGGSAQRTVPPPGGNPFVEPLVNEGNTGVATVPAAVIEFKRQQLTR